jgi:hypothetical protein
LRGSFACPHSAARRGRARTTSPGAAASSPVFLNSGPALDHCRFSPPRPASSGRASRCTARPSPEARRRDAHQAAVADLDVAAFMSRRRPWSWRSRSRSSEVEKHLHPAYQPRQKSTRTPVSPIGRRNAEFTAEIQRASGYRDIEVYRLEGPSRRAHGSHARLWFSNTAPACRARAASPREAVRARRPISRSRRAPRRECWSGRELGASTASIRPDASCGGCRTVAINWLRSSPTAGPSRRWLRGGKYLRARRHDPTNDGRARRR